MLVHGLVGPHVGTRALQQSGDVAVEVDLEAFLDDGVLEREAHVLVGRTLATIGDRIRCCGRAGRKQDESAHPNEQSASTKTHVPSPLSGSPAADDVYA